MLTLCKLNTCLLCFSLPIVEAFAPPQKFSGGGGYKEEQEQNKGYIGEKKRASCLISTMVHEAFLER